jgi:hypothetical protein
VSRPVRPDLRPDDRSAAPPGAGPQTTPGPHPDAAPSSTAEVPWRRLDPRMLVVHPVAGLVRLLPAFAVVLLTGREGDLTHVYISLGAAAMIVVFGVLRWRFTQYRITPDGSSCTAAGSAASAARCRATASGRSTSPPGWSTGSSDCPW